MIVLFRVAQYRTDDTEAAVSIESCHRTGCMAAFETFSQFEQYADEMLDLLEDFASPATVSARVLEALESGSESRISTSINISMSLNEARGSQEEADQVILDDCDAQLYIKINF